MSLPYATLTIDGLPIAGGNALVTISRGDAWCIWWKWFAKNVAGGRPHSLINGIREKCVWKINGEIIKPTVWFLEF